ncbi:hypothetical protein LSTR_LSTR003424 [Laodelphax striatellus]|uniref:Uncharacterized protein n=1 Tax=Laodelphax striatellus TaxID=195883 RepID=A0A482X1Z1_LAOST|nr:hypothetical protein LSTR_LSTR003424 [Laodelphax striatellus]
MCCVDTVLEAKVNRRSTVQYSRPSETSKALFVRQRPRQESVLQSTNISHYTTEGSEPARTFPLADHSSTEVKSRIVEAPEHNSGENRTTQLFRKELLSLQQCSPFSARITEEEREREDVAETTKERATDGRIHTNRQRKKINIKW